MESSISITVSAGKIFQVNKFTLWPNKFLLTLLIKLIFPPIMKPILPLGVYVLMFEDIINL